MRKLAGDIWTMRLMGLCAVLGLLLVLNSIWRPQPHLPQSAVSGRAGEQPEKPETAGDQLVPDAETAAAPGAQARPRRNVKALPAYRETLQRPLFHASRRPVAPKLAKPKTPPKPKAPPRSNLNGIRLTGVIMTAEKAFGLLSIPGQSELTRAREGQVVKGWKVTAVEEDALVLNNGEEDFRMALWEDKPGQGALARPKLPQGSKGRPASIAGKQE